ncbi:MAG: protein translocase subunit SecD, partial [Ferrovum sp.]|nr:protein translocase subunit SecD [Ferrovum sp.]
MNKFPLWKNGLILLALVLGTLYTLPNFFGQSPAVQISAQGTTAKVDSALAIRVEQVLHDTAIPYIRSTLDESGIKIRFADPDTQLKARDVVDRALNPEGQQAGYVVALNLVPNSPRWLSDIGALPMYLGLDLSGGVHFLLQVDMKAALTKRLDSYASEMRGALRDKRVYYDGITRDGNRVTLRFRDEATRATAHQVLDNEYRDLIFKDEGSGADLSIVTSLKQEALTSIQDQALKQNILALRNRVNELGAKEPIIQQQGSDRIIVQLPGVQDTAKAKDIIGRTATLEIRLVDEDHAAPTSITETPPFGDELVLERGGAPVFVKKQVVLTGEVITDAGAGFDSQSNRPSVNISMDSKGARIIRQVSRDNLKKRMAILLIEKGRTEAISVATIQDELGARFQI